MTIAWQNYARALALMALGISFVHAATAPVSFSATYQSTSRAAVQNPAEMGRKGTIWVANGKIRTEYLDEGHVMAHIMDPAQHTLYLMVPDQGFYEDDSKGGIPALPRKAPTVWIYNVADPCSSDTGTTCTHVGVDNVDGRACESWQFARDSESWTVCIDKSTGIALRKIEGDHTFELANVKVGKINPRLFELSPGLKKGGFTIMPARLRPPTSAPGGSPPADINAAPSAPIGQSGR
jgi:hypothetical protein